MSISTNKTFNGVSYTIPAQGESNWGTNVSSYLIAIADGALQKTGGTFTLTADVDFGGSYGLKAMKFSSRSTPSTTGIVRLGNNEAVAWRNAANSADLAFKVNASNVLEFNGNPMLTLALGTANYILKMNSVGTAYEWGELANANIAADAGIVDTKLATIATAGKVSNSATTAASANTASAIVARDGSGNFLTTSINSTTIPTSKTIVVTTDKLSVLAATTSAELAGVISDETGSGALVFAASPTLSGDVLLQNAAGAQPTLSFSEDPDNGTNKVTIKAPTTLAGDYTLTLPTDDGGANQVLTTDGSGVLSWSTVATTVTTTRGDVIKRGASADERLAIGAADTVIVSDGTDPSWGLTVKSGTYTATLTNASNCSVLTFNKAQYLRIGSIVYVTVYATITTTAAAPTNSYFYVSLPIASNLAVTGDLVGSGTRYRGGNTAKEAVAIEADTAGDRAVCYFGSTEVTAAGIYLSFMYEIK